MNRAEAETAADAAIAAAKDARYTYTNAQTAYAYALARAPQEGRLNQLWAREMEAARALALAEKAVTAALSNLAKTNEGED